MVPKSFVFVYDMEAYDRGLLGCQLMYMIALDVTILHTISGLCNTTDPGVAIVSTSCVLGNKTETC